MEWKFFFIFCIMIGYHTFLVPTLQLCTRHSKLQNCIYLKLFKESCLLSAKHFKWKPFPCCLIFKRYLIILSKLAQETVYRKQLFTMLFLEIDSSTLFSFGLTLKLIKKNNECGFKIPLILGDPYTYPRPVQLYHFQADLISATVALKQ
jgi:hypothetical protein